MIFDFKSNFCLCLLCFIILYVTPKGSTKNSWLFEDNVFIIQIFKLIMYLMNIFLASIWVLLFFFFFIKIVKRIHKHFWQGFIIIYIVFQYLTKTFLSWLFLRSINVKHPYIILYQYEGNIIHVLNISCTWQSFDKKGQKKINKIITKDEKFWLIINFNYFLS